MDGPLLEILNIRVSLGPGNVILEDVTIRISSGEWFVLVGPNGSGKTTLLRSMAGLVPLDAGSVRLLGAPLGGRREVAQKIAFLRQTEEAPSGFSVREVVSLGRAPFQMGWMPSSDHDRRVTELALEKVGITALAERDISELSGGEQKLVHLARALAQSPHILLLDEPTAHLDLENEARIVAVLKSEIAAGLALVTVLHDVRLAREVATRGGLMHKGKLVRDGEPADAFSPSSLREVFGALPSA